MGNGSIVFNMLMGTAFQHLSEYTSQVEIQCLNEQQCRLQARHTVFQQLHLDTALYYDNISNRLHVQYVVILVEWALTCFETYYPQW